MVSAAPVPGVPVPLPLDFPLSDCPLLDRDVLVRLGSILSADRLEVLLGKCRHDAGERVEALQAFSAAGDLPSLRAQAHNLIALAGTIGARRAQTLAASLQSACDNGEAIAACALAASLATALADTWTAMDEAFPPGQTPGRRPGTHNA